MSENINYDKYKKLLSKERRRLEDELKALHLEEVNIMSSEIGQYDASDAGSGTYELTRTKVIQENYKEIIEQIDEALRKIDDKTYGKCDRCGEIINSNRLKAIPYATFCIECQGTIETR